MRTESEIKQRIEHLESLICDAKKKMESARDELTFDISRHHKIGLQNKINALKWVIS